MLAVQSAVCRNLRLATSNGKLSVADHTAAPVTKLVPCGSACLVPTAFSVFKRRKQLVARTAAIVHDPAPTQPLPTADLISLPIDYYKLLQLTTASPQQVCNRTYETLIQNPPNLGLSRAAVLNRERVLAQAALYVVDPETRRLYDETLPKGRAQVEVEYDDLPGVFCLLYEAGELGTVVEWGKAWLKEHYDDPRARDVAILVAMGYWDGGVTLLDANLDAVVLVSESLEDGLDLLERYKASSELKEKLILAIQELRPAVALKLVSLPLDASHSDKRDKGLQLLQHMFDSDPHHYFKSPDGLSNYLTAVRAQLTTSEQALVLSKIALTIDSSVAEAFEVALGYIAEGCKNYQPMLIKKAEEILDKYTGGVYDADPNTDLNPLDITVGRAVCQILLGRMDRAGQILGLTNETQATADPMILQFITEHSPSVDEPLPGIIFLAQRWLEDIAFSTCRDAAPDGPFSLDNWLDNSKVKLYTQVLDSGGDKVVGLIEKVSDALGEATKSITGTAQQQRGDRGVVDGDEYYASNGSDWSSRPVVGDAALPLEQQERALWESHYATNKRSPWTVPLMVLGIGAALAGGYFLRATSTSNESGNAPPVAALSTATTQVGPPAGAAVSGEVSAEPIAAPLMTADEAHAVVKQWQATKADALGPKHALRKLDGVLSGTMLDQWKQRAQDVKDSGWHWEYHLSSMHIDSVRDTSGGGGKSVTVEASFDEVASIVEEGAVQESYANKYSIQYQLVKEGGKWKISTGHILNY